jgi:hypothetical protein
MIVLIDLSAAVTSATGSDVPSTNAWDKYTARFLTNRFCAQQLPKQQKSPSSEFVVDDAHVCAENVDAVNDTAARNNIDAEVCANAFSVLVCQRNQAIRYM